MNVNFEFLAKVWLTTHFGNIFRQLRIVDEKLKPIQSALIHNENCPSVMASQDKLLAEQTKLLHFKICVGK